MSFDLFTPDPDPRVPEGMHAAVTGGAHRRVARRRAAFGSAAALALVAAALPFMFRDTPDAEVNADQRPDVTVAPAPTSTTVVPVTPIVVRGTQGGENFDCEPPVLAPSYLPEGFVPVRAELEYPADWQTTYARGDERIIVIGDVSGDWGETLLRAETVRDQPASMAAETVTWTELGPCESQHGVDGKGGVDAETVLRVAQSLHRDLILPPVGLKYRQGSNKDGSPAGFVESVDPAVRIEHFIDRGTSAMVDDSGNRLFVNWFHAADGDVLWSAVVDQHQPNGTAVMRVLDVVTIPPFAAPFRARVGCKGPGDDGEGPVFAVARYDEETGEQAEVRNAWRVNTATHKFAVIDTEGVTCHAEPTGL